VRRRAFTLIEVLVVVAIIALLVAILLPSLSRAREVAKRTVCLSNHHMIGLAWMFYHTDNKGAFVYAGATVAPNPSDPNDWYKTNPPGWVRYIPGHLYDPWNATEAQQLQALRDGALYKFARTTDIYKCPSTPKNQTRSYGGHPGLRGTNPSSPEFASRIDQIKRPVGRILYLDTELEDWDAYWMIWWEKNCWWNQIVLRHGPGATVGFADGHSEWWRWSDQRTITYMSHPWQWCEDNIFSNPEDNNRDKIRLRIGCYGRLGP
jgi:prepilin-type N-terminal cleavage/methylation domain-containing protein/prepilin-type processing-associated H-X9-DG protein